MRANDGQQPTVRTVVSAMAAAPVEQHEAFVPQKRFHLSEADTLRRVPHLLY